MQSAFGNFDNTGKVLTEQQTPESSYKVLSEHNVEWCASKIVALEDEIARLKTVAPVVSEPTNNVLNVLNYVTKDEWDHFEGLIMCMLANGAMLVELQQRLMGFI